MTINYHHILKLLTNISTFFTAIRGNIIQSSLVVGIVVWLKRITFPGFRGVPAYDVLRFFVKEVRNETLVTRANAIAFSFFLSLFPSIVLVFTLMAYLPIYANFSDWISGAIKGVMPGNAGTMLIDAIHDILTTPRSGLLSFSFLLVIFFASNGMMAMMKGFEKAQHTAFRKRTPLIKRAVAIQLTFMLGLLLAASVVLVILGNTLIELLSKYMNLDVVSKYLLYGMRWLIILTVFYGGMWAIYRFGTSIRRRYRAYAPGAVLATVGSMVASIGFSFYVDNFGNYNKLYGSIGTIIVLMLWLQLNAFIILVGFELNAAIAINRAIRAEALQEGDSSSV